VCKHGQVQRRRTVLRAFAAAGLAVCLGVLTATALAPRGLRASAAAATTRSTLTAQRTTTVSATVAATPSGAALPPGYVGVSIEFNALHDYTGRDSAKVNPILVGLLRALAPGQSPVIRIGGNSEDQTWWPVRGTIPPGGVRYTLTPDWLGGAHALAAALHARMIPGINLAADRPALAGSEARALVQGIGRRYIDSLEIGNEPDVYSVFPWFSGRKGLSYYARPRDYDVSLYVNDFSRWAGMMPGLPLAGPAFAELTWLSGLSQFIGSEPRLNEVTVHRYPLRACVTDPIAPGFPTIPALLSDNSSYAMAQSLAPYVTVAHDAGRPFRVGEMNSAACRGRRGVSNTFAAALWVLDTLFNFASVGVDGVNVHTLPNAPYELFTFTNARGRWRAFVHPEYYGMLMFAQAFPTGAQLLGVTAPAGPVKIWATRSSTGRIRVVLINKSTSTPASVQLNVPDAGGRASLEWMRAPAVSAASGVTLGGRGFGTSSPSGALGSMRTTPITATAGTYTITLPAASAVMLTQ
jgi:hypothetical protein